MALVLQVRERLHAAPVVRIPLREVIEAAGGRFWKLPDPVVAEVFRLWDAGRNTSEIAAAVGISESAAARYVQTHRERGNPRRPPHYGRVREVLEKHGPELRAAYEAGGTIHALATSVRIHSVTLRGYLIDHGVEIRTGIGRARRLSA
jgi:hypothetical protein